jgi:hypothetical protein
MAYTTIDNPELFFQCKLYAGNDSGQSITLDGSEDMSPNMVWIKDRGGTDPHGLYDSVRGALKQLRVNLSNEERTLAGSLTSFDSDGFTVGNDDGTNDTGHNFVSWNWKAGTSASGNTSGQGTAKSYSSSSNSTSGFSIVKYVGNGTANHAIPHGCGAAPTMVIVKTTTYSNQAWPVDCREGNDGSGGIMYLNETGTLGSYADSSPFTSVAPTSSVFSVGSPGNTNLNDETYIAYCFAEKSGYSSIRQYIGNGNADGTFVYTGFKPAMVIIKRGDTGSSDWVIIDNKRDSFNVVNTKLFSSNSDGDVTSQNACDFVSNGFKLKDDATNAFATNISGSKYIYIAFAENPFVTSSGVPATAR